MNNMKSKCEEYTGYRNRDGYGIKQVNHKKWLTHRLAWTEKVGPIPEGMLVLHHCDNPPCCNVEHLYVGTPADNSRDKVERGRAKGGHPAKDHCRRGHEFTPDNTYIVPKTGRRQCKTCRNRKERYAGYGYPI